MSSTEDILAKEIESWKGFEYALRESIRKQNPLQQLLGECIKSTNPVSEEIRVGL